MAAETAANGQEALDALDASEPGHFDVVLMDIQMPVMNGLEATRRIRESERDDLRALPVVVLSANAFTEDVQESKRAGADAHLRKGSCGNVGWNPRALLILAALASLATLAALVPHGPASSRAYGAARSRRIVRPFAVLR